MGILIRQALNLGGQIFRLNRGTPVPTRSGGSTFIPRPGWWEAKECRDVGCEHYLLGWITRIDPNTELGQRQLHYIRKESGRAFKERRSDTQGSIIEFFFEEGQKCFREHERPVDRDPVFANLALGHTQIMDYDQFHETFNEVTEQRKQKKRGI